MADTVSGIGLLTMTQEEFQKKYGQATETETLENPIYGAATVKYTYDWGYAVFTRTSGDMYLAELYFTDTGTFTGPRGTAVGNTESQVVSAFRDMGQVESPSGNRGLYSNSTGVGKIYAQEDGGKIIRYTAGTADSHTWKLEYTLNASGTVTAIDFVYLP